MPDVGDRVRTDTSLSWEEHPLPIRDVRDEAMEAATKAYYGNRPGYPTRFHAAVDAYEQVMVHRQATPPSPPVGADDEHTPRGRSDA